MKFFDDVFTFDTFNTQCEWLPANQFLFQLANLFLVLTYFAKPNSLAGLMQLRFALTMSGLCFGLWGAIVICALDCMIWNVAFAIGNAAHLIYLIVKTRPIKFSTDHELLYKEIFRPVGIKRFQYGELASISNKRFLNKGDCYAKQGVTESCQIAILLSGSIIVTLENSVIHHIDKLEFIDSPEWIATDDNMPTTYQVSLIAQQTCDLYVWKRGDLIKLFKKDVMIKNVFDSLIGKDICKKLFSLHRKFLTDDSLHTNININTNNILHQAPLLTYSAANLMMRVNDDTPLTSPNTDNINNHNISIINEDDDRRSIYDDADVCYDPYDTSSLLLKETNL